MNTPLLRVLPPGEAMNDVPLTADALYHHDIANTAMLTAEEELALAKAIEQGDAAKNRIASGEQLDEPVLDELEVQVGDGDRARLRMIEANLRLVIHVARRYESHGVPLLDLIQEGNIGLARAVDKFDWRFGFRFSTYAYWWIHQGVRRAVGEQSGAIRMPAHVMTAIGKLYKVVHELEQELFRAPTVDEIALRMELTVERVNQLLQLTLRSLSLQTPLGGERDGGGSIGDLIADPQIRSPYEEVDRASLKLHLQNAMQNLRDRERLVLELRFGLAEGGEQNLTTVAGVLGVTPERVRQIETAALTKLRRCPLGSTLFSYLDRPAA